MPPTLDLLQQSRSTLTNNDWRILSNVIHAYDAFSSIPYACQVSEQLSRLEISGRSVGSTTLEMVGRSILSMRSLISSLPDFQILTTAEQISLLERNWYAISGLNYILIARDSSLIENLRYLRDSGDKLYRADVVAGMIGIKKRIDPDSTLIKIILVILAFSSNCLVLNVPRSRKNDSFLFGTFRLFGSQNVFVEILWKYMVYRYGHEESVIRFARLVMEMLNVINQAAAAYSSTDAHRSIMEQAFEQNDQWLSAIAKTPVPLWGNR